MSERSVIGDKFYRYNDPGGVEGVTLWLEELSVVSITPAGYWLTYGWPNNKDKFVLHDARKRYAYPTKELALKSYIIRKNWQLRHLANTKAKAERGLFIAKEMKKGREIKPVSLLGDFL